MEPSSPVAVVTGASGGIGVEVVDRLANWCRVAAIYHQKKPQADGTNNVRWYQVDITNPDQVRSAVDQINADFGQAASLCVSCAGVVDDDLLVRLKPDSYRRVINVNLMGAVNVIQAVVRPMVRQRYGRIVLVSSVAGVMGAPGQTAYAASKAALIGFGRSLVREVASKGVTVNVVAPGPIDTPMLDPVRERMTDIASLSPSGRIGTPGDVAAVVDFLLTPGARHVNGAVIPVDGGLSMGT